MAAQPKTPEQIHENFLRIRQAVKMGPVWSFVFAAVLLLMGVSMWWLLAVIFGVELLAMKPLLNSLQRSEDRQVEEARRALAESGATVYPDVGV